jgi:hypothetical protein
MKDFIKKIVSDKEGTPSSKRIMSFIAIILLVIYTIVAMFQTINMEVYYTLAALTGYNGLLTILPKRKTPKEI